MKRALFCTLCLVCALPAYSETTYAPAANVEYVSQRLSQLFKNKFGFSIGITDNANTSSIANMQYLLGTIDRINSATGNVTNYVNTPQSTNQAINTKSIDDAFNTLVAPYKFYLTVNGTNSYTFEINASGTFIVNCGTNGNFNDSGTPGAELLTMTPTAKTTITCTWPDSGEHIIALGGQATGYDSTLYTDGSGTTTPQYSTIRFPKGNNLIKISGGLGKIFSTLSNGKQPMFYKTFADQTGLTTIPEDLFSTIDENDNVVAGINGAPGESMFSHTFTGSTGLTGKIPANLFAGVRGAPAERMFFATFYGTSNINTIGETDTEGLFTRIDGNMAREMYRDIFQKSGLTKLPSKLFGYTDFGNTDNHHSAFLRAFTDNYNLSGTPATAQTSADGEHVELWKIPAYSTQITSHQQYKNYANQPNMLWIYHNTNIDNSSGMHGTWKN